MSNQKIYLSASNPSVRVPVREVTLSNNERLRLYDTSGPYTDPEFTPDIKQGLPPLRRHWVLARADVEPGASGRWGLRAKPGHRVTQMHYARRAEITPEMEFVALREGMSPEIVRILNQGIAKSLAAPDLRERFAKAGSVPLASTPEELRKRYEDWSVIFGRIAKDVGIQPH